MFNKKLLELERLAGSSQAHALSEEGIVAASVKRKILGATTSEIRNRNKGSTLGKWCGIETVTNQFGSKLLCQTFKDQSLSP